MLRPTPSVPQALLQEARRLVDREPAIEAIVLFGSRARGEAGPESDYDLAVVSTATNRDVHALCEPLARADEAVQIVPVAPQALRTYRNTCNRVERAVVVDGQPLAGAWRRPRHRKEACEMDHAAFANGFTSFISSADATIRDIARARAEAATGTNNGAFNAFRAGEHAAKATLSLYGLTPRKLHGVNQLAEQLRSSRRGARDQNERENLANQIDQLNGNSKKLNELPYTLDLFELTAATEHRLALAAKLAERCLDLYARKATGPSRKVVTPADAHARALKRIAGNLYDSPESLHKHPSRQRLNVQSNAAIDSLCTRAAEWITSQQRSKPDVAAQASAKRASSELYGELDQHLDPLVDVMLKGLTKTGWESGPSVPEDIRAHPWWSNDAARGAICQKLQLHLDRPPGRPDVDNVRESIDANRAQIIDQLHQAVWPHTPAGQNAKRDGVDRPVQTNTNPPQPEGRGGTGFGC